MALLAPTPAPANDQLRAKRLPQCPATAEPFLSVVIVNYCQWRNTSRLTRQLRQSHCARNGEAEIVIVDNRSPRHPLLAKLRRATGVSVRRFGRNRGFARAVNEGTRLSRGQWILLLNPDTSIASGLLDQVEALARQVLALDPRTGVIGLNIRNSDGSAQPSCGPLPTLTGTLGGLFLPRWRRKCRPLALQCRTVVPWATGCALLIRRDCLSDVRGFDEDFFLYYEDVDFCRRAAARGWTVCFEPGLKVTHHTPLHSRKPPAALRMMTRHALLTYGVKHWPRWQAALMGSIIWMESGLRQLASRYRGRDHDMRIHGQIRRIVGDVLAGRDREARTRIRRTAECLAEAAVAMDGKSVESKKPAYG